MPIKKLSTIAAALLMVAIVASGCGSDAKQVAKGASDEPVTTPVPSIPDAATVNSGRLVAVRSGRLVLLERDGTLVRELVNLEHGDNAPVSSWVSTDGTNAYYEGFVDDANSDPMIRRVPLAGGDSSDVVRGELPTVSADGKRLAYVASTSEGDQLMLRQLDTGDEMNYANDVAGNAPIASLSWAPNNNLLAISYGGGEKLDQHKVLVINAPDPKGLDAASEIKPSVQSNWRGWAAFTSDSNVFLIDACCTGFPPNEFHSSTLLVVDQLGALVRKVADGPADVEITDLVAAGGARPAFFWLQDGRLTTLAGEAQAPSIIGDGYSAIAAVPTRT